MTQVLDLRALVLATGRFDAERDFKLRWPASLRVESATQRSSLQFLRPPAEVEDAALDPKTLNLKP